MSIATAVLATLNSVISKVLESPILNIDIDLIDMIDIDIEPARTPFQRCWATPPESFCILYRKGEVNPMQL